MSKIVNILVWTAAKLAVVAQTTFSVAVALDGLKKKETSPKPEKPAQQNKVDEEASIHKFTEAVLDAGEEIIDDDDDDDEYEYAHHAEPTTVMSVHDGRGEELKLADITEPLPQYEVFAAMFERRYGKFGKMPISIQGEARLYDAQTLYVLLQKIAAHKNPNAMMHAIYGSVLSVVMHGEGENPKSPEFLN